MQVVINSVINNSFSKPTWLAQFHPLALSHSKFLDLFSVNFLIKLEGGVERSLQLLMSYFSPGPYSLTSVIFLGPWVEVTRRSREEKLLA